MKKAKRKKLEAAGWVVGTADQFLALMNKPAYLTKTCPRCGASRGDYCGQISWPHKKTRPHKARLKKLKKKP